MPKHSQPQPRRGPADGAAHRQRRKSKGARKQKRGGTLKRSKASDPEEIAELLRRVKEDAPERGSQEAPRARFDELAISRYMKAGLKDNKFTKMTKIQRISLPHALAGRDVLGAGASSPLLSSPASVTSQLFQPNAFDHRSAHVHARSQDWLRQNAIIHNTLL